MQLWLKNDQVSRKVLMHRALLFAAVTVFVLFMFQPFGTHDTQISFKFLRLSGYGLVTFCALLMAGMIEIYSLKFFKLNKARKFVVPLGYIVILAFFNHSYFVVAVLGQWQWQNQLAFVGYILVIGLFPVCFLYLANLHAKSIAKSDPTDAIESPQQAERVSQTPENKMLTLSGENKDDNLKINLDQLVMIKSADNYCELVCKENNQTQHKLLRCSLTNLMQQFTQESQVIRCHRSYAVNLRQVVSSSGNAGGLKLTLAVDDLVVPVSRTYVKAVKHTLSLVPMAC